MAGRNVFARIGVQMDADQARRELESINDGVTKLGNARLDTARTQFEQLGTSVGKTASAYQPLTEAQRRAYEQREDDVQQIGRLQRSYATLGGALSALDVQVQHGHRSAQDAARLQAGLIEAYSKGAVANDNLAASYQRIIASIDPAIATQKRYEMALADLRAGAAAAGVSVEQLAADEAKLAAAMSPAALAAQKEAAALEALLARLNPADEAARRAAAAHALLDRALAGQIPGVKLSAEQHAVLTQRLQANAAASVAAAQGNARLSGSMTNLSYQLQDAIVQAQMGTNGFIILAQQGSQAASAFGPMGAAIGTVLSIVGAAGKVLFGLGESAGSAASSVELLGRTVAAQGDDVEALTAKYERLTEAQRNLEGINLLSDLKKSRGALGDATKELEEAIKDSVPRMLLDFRDIDTPLKPVREILKEISSGSIDASEGLIKAETALRQTGLSAGFFDQAVLDAASKVGEMGDKTKLAEAFLAVFSGTATAAQHALVNYTVAAKNAANAATDIALASGQAAAGLFWQEEDLDRKIAALKSGEAAMKSYGEEQVRAAAYKKAYDDAIKADMPTLYAEETATRLATKAVEAHRLELQRAEEQKAANAADRKAESQVERDAKAYAKVSEELDRGIAEQQRLAGVVGQSVAAQREANTETKIAESLSKAHTTASTAEGKAIAGKVREQEKWRAAAADAAVLDSSKRQLAYAEKELSLMGQAEPLRDRALKSFQIQQEAQEKLKTTTPELVAQWVQYQEQIADTQAIKAFQQEIQGTAKEMSRDVTEALLDRESKWSDLGKTIGKRIALGLIEANIVLPITTAIVGSVPGLFGINTPANQNAAGLTGQASSLATNWAGGKALSWAGDKLGITGSGGITGAIDSFGYSAFGLGGAGAYAVPGATAGTVVQGGMILEPGAGAVGMAEAVPGAAGATAGLSAYLGAAGAGAVGGTLGGLLGTATNSKAVGGLSGAALGAGASSLAAYMGLGAVGGPVGMAIGAVVGGVMGLLGTQKASVGPNSQGNVVVSGGRFAEGPSAADNGGDATGVRQATAQIAAAMNAMVTAYGLRAPDGTYGLFEGGPKVKGNGVRTPEELIRQLVGSLSADGLVGRALGSDVIKGSADLEQINRYLSLARSIETATTALSDLDKSLAGVQKAAFKAAADGLQPMLAELRAAGEIGASAEYKALVSGQVANLLDDIANPRTYTETQTAVATLTGQLAAWKSVLEQVNPELAATVDTIQRAGLERIYGEYRKSWDASMNEATDRGYLNQLTAVRDRWNASWADDLSAGRDPTKLYEAQAKQIFAGLAAAQLETVVGYFAELDPVMSGLAKSQLEVVRATEAQTTASKQAAALLAANKGLDSRYFSAVGRGYLNDVQGLLDSLSADREALSAGGQGDAKAYAVFWNSLQSSMSQLSAAQMDDVAATFGDAVFGLGGLVRSLRDTAAATSAATAAQQAQGQAAQRVAGTIQSLTSYASGLAFSDLSALAPEAQYSLATSQFQAVSGAALAGDYNSLSQLQSYSDAYLRSARGQFGSGQGYADAFARVTDVLSRVATVDPDRLTASSMAFEQRTQTAAITTSIAELTAVMKRVEQLLAANGQKPARVA